MVRLPALGERPARARGGQVLAMCQAVPLNPHPARPRSALAFSWWGRAKKGSSQISDSLCFCVYLESTPCVGCSQLCIGGVGGRPSSAGDQEAQALELRMEPRSPACKTRTQPFELSPGLPFQSS